MPVSSKGGKREIAWGDGSRGTFRAKLSAMRNEQTSGALKPIIRQSMHTNTPAISIANESLSPSNKITEITKFLLTPHLMRR